MMGKPELKPSQTIVKCKMTPTQAGRLLMEKYALEDKVKELEKQIHSEPAKCQNCGAAVIGSVGVVI